MLSVGAAALVVPVAHADEVYSRPFDGVFRLNGHGFGHGRGMSQWGAQGAALTGISYDNILAFYYPGTTRTMVGNALIRVSLTADSSQLRVSPTAGLSVVQSNGTRTILPDGYTGWRLYPTGSGLQLQETTGSGWTAFALSGSTNLTSPLRFETSGGLIRAWRADGTSKDYRGTLSALASGMSVITVDTLPLESYLRGVVPQESPASWQSAALQAQAVAARTFATAKMRAASATATSDICDTNSCQVFGGSGTYSAYGTRTAIEQVSTDAAITASAGVILSYQGIVANTEFAASSGGWTAPGGQPYLVGKQDPYDAVSAANSSATWQASLPVSSIENRFPDVGSLLRMVVTSRNG